MTDERSALAWGEYELNRESVQAENLVSWYPECRFDMIGGNHGTPIAGAIRVPGPAGSTAMWLNGVNGYVEIADADRLTLAAGFTAACWIRFASATARAEGIMCKVSGTTVREWELGKYSDNLLYAAVVDENSDGFGGRVAPIPSVGAWHHLAMSYDGGITQASVKIYVNGVQTDNANLGTMTDFVAIRNTSAPVILGRSTWLVVGHLSGSQRDFRLYNAALPRSTIAAMVNPATRFDLWKPRESARGIEVAADGGGGGGGGAGPGNILMTDRVTYGVLRFRVTRRY